jgi:DNA repair protein RadC
LAFGGRTNNCVVNDSDGPTRAFDAQAASLTPREQATIRRARRLLERQLRNPGEAINSPASVTDYLLLRLALKPHEVFCVLTLDNRHRVLDFQEMFRGTIDNTTVYPREIVKEVLRVNAAAVILAHNHPSGIPEPSDADRLITRRVRDALELVDVRLLDHFIVGGTKAVSLASRGLL